MKKIKYTINLLFFIYFVILLVERMTSVILSVVNNVKVFSSGYYIYVYMSIFISIIAFFLYLAIKCKNNINALFNYKKNDLSNLDYKDLVIASSILLISGMVHSEYTISVVQFISYGFFIAAIILQAVLLNKDCNNKKLLWLSVAYLVAFSMAIPVSYPTELKYYTLFYIVEGLATYSLVGVFMLLAYDIFDNKIDLFNPIYIIAAVILDGLVIGLKWTEEINMFVLIFISLSLILYIPGIIISTKSKRLKK